MSLDLDGYKAITFDCFGTLIDWDTGVANFLGPWAVRTGFAGKVADVIGRFAEHQYTNQRIRPFKNYRDVIRDAMAAAVSDLRGTISTRELDTFAEHVGDWPAFADTVDSLRHFKSLGLHLGVVSNVDNASFADAHMRLGGLIDTIVTAEMVGAYTNRTFRCSRHCFQNSRRKAWQCRRYCTSPKAAFTTLPQATRSDWTSFG